MQIYRGKLELLDYVFYATTERGKVYETGRFIHNYAIAYALGLVQNESYTYARLEQRPHYSAELSPLNGRIYITPGTPVETSYRLVQWNTLPERYSFPGKPPSIGYPDWGFARMLRPGVVFQLFILVSNLDAVQSRPSIVELLDGKSLYLRLGKFAGKAKLQLEAAESVENKREAYTARYFPGQDERHSHHEKRKPQHDGLDVYLNWRDLTQAPLVSNVLPSSLPTRLIFGAHFPEGSFYEARFVDGSMVYLPADMGFLAREP